MMSSSFSTPQYVFKSFGLTLKILHSGFVHSRHCWLNSFYFFGLIWPGSSILFLPFPQVGGLHISSSEETLPSCYTIFFFFLHLPQTNSLFLSSYYFSKPSKVNQINISVPVSVSVFVSLPFSISISSTLVSISSPASIYPSINHWIYFYFFLMDLKCH